VFEATLSIRQPESSQPHNMRGNSPKKLLYHALLQPGILNTTTDISFRHRFQLLQLGLSQFNHNHLISLFLPTPIPQFPVKNGHPRTPNNPPRLPLRYILPLSSYTCPKLQMNLLTLHQTSLQSLNSSTN
jgi:hypothetical protein